MTMAFANPCADQLLHLPISQPQAIIARHLVLETVLDASNRIKQNEFTDAILILNRLIFKNPTGFALDYSSLNQHFFDDFNQLNPQSESLFTKDLMSRLKYPPRVTVDEFGGLIKIHHLPRRGDRDLKLYSWAKSHWIRVVSEELVHVAQFLGQYANQRVWFVSKTLTEPNSIILEGNSNAELREADAYAFLIEAYGREFIPEWYGSNSGYPIRQEVDRLYPK